MSGKLIHNLKRRHCETNDSSHSPASSSSSLSPHNEIIGSGNIVEVDILPPPTRRQRRLSNNAINQQPDLSPASTNRTAAVDTVAADDQHNEPKTDEFLLNALRKIQELQHQISLLDDDIDSSSSSLSPNDQENSDDDSGAEVEHQQVLAFEAEALGFAMCARETISFLTQEGFAPDNPLLLALRAKLVGQLNGVPF